ncbi:hypothetical protein KKG63_01460, partial [Patescibacteria group bacterium]|nr:hypothetical protein [Patescibacteria group bacterium]
MINIKSQKIVPSVPADAAQASFAIAAEDYFAVVSYESKNTLNTQVAQNIVTDILAHGLILEDANASLQVLEKTLKDCKEAWQKISEDVVFSAVLAWFKADFVYVSIYGNAKALYLDGTEMVHLDTEKEGHFAGGTQQIDDGKVMVLCTHDFFIKFPPKSLVSLDQPIAAQDLDDLSSAIILKVDKVAEEPSMKEKAIEKVKPVGRLPIRGKIAQIPVRRFLKPALIGLGVLILITGGYFLLKATLFKPKDQLQTNQTTTDSNEMQNGEQSGEDPEIQDELSKKLDEANKVRRVQPQVFYDISIADAKTNPGELAQGQTYLAVSDPAQGKIYISSKEVTKFEELPQLFPGVKNLLFDGDTLIFTDNEGVKFYALATKSVNKSYLMAEAYPVLGPSSEYLGFTYAISRDSLIKF